MNYSHHNGNFIDTYLILVHFKMPCFVKCILLDSTGILIELEVPLTVCYREGDMRFFNS